MCHVKLLRVLGMGAICFGAGILLSFVLPGVILAFLEALALIVAGVLILGKHH